LLYTSTHLILAESGIKTGKGAGVHSFLQRIYPVNYRMVNSAKKKRERLQIILKKDGRPDNSSRAYNIEF